MVVPQHFKLVSVYDSSLMFVGFKVPGLGSPSADGYQGNRWQSTLHGSTFNSILKSALTLSHHVPVCVVTGS